MPAIAAFLIVRTVEAVFCVLPLALLASAGGDIWEPAGLWARHEFLYGFIILQALVWRIFGRLIELRVLALTAAVAVYAVIAGYPAAFAVIFAAAQAVIELAVWGRMQRV